MVMDAYEDICRTTVQRFLPWMGKEEQERWVWRSFAAANQTACASRDDGLSADQSKETMIDAIASVLSEANEPVRSVSHWGLFDWRGRSLNG